MALCALASACGEATYATVAPGPELDGLDVINSASRHPLAGADGE